MRTFILCILILSGCKTNTADTRQAVSLIEDSIVHLNGALSINGTNMVNMAVGSNLRFDWPKVHGFYPLHFVLILVV